MNERLRIIIPIVCAVIVGITALSFGRSSSVTPTPEVALPPVATTTAAAPAPAASVPQAAPAPELPPAAAAGLTEVASTTEDVPDPSIVATEKLNASGNELLQSAVNILCLPLKKGAMRGISGSGVIISPNGIIVTAAHVGQYFLLADYPKPDSMRCTVRTGNPATDAYTAQLIYISPDWVRDNAADTLTEDAPKGTGENDFAFLAITGSANGAALPSSFNSVPLSSATPHVGDPVAVVAYGAQYLSSQAIETALAPIFSINAVNDRFTFGGQRVDLIEVTGTAAAQEGSSGGGVVDIDGGLIGVITTSTSASSTAPRSLHAITPLHLRTSFQEDTGTNLDSYLVSAPPTALADQFSSEATSLTNYIEHALR